MRALPTSRMAKCISCGAPESQADGPISHDPDGHCFFCRQPLTEDETNAAIRGELGMSSQCDGELPDDRAQVVRNCARFEYVAPNRNLSRRKSLRNIIDHIAVAVGKYQGSELVAFRCWWKEASFSLRWGKAGKESGYTVLFKVIWESSGWWLLRIFEHEVAHTAFAIQVDKALRQETGFRSISWFDDNEWPSSADRGQVHPY